MITIRSNCRVCGAGFDPLLDLGDPCLSDFLDPDQPDPFRAPLDLVICRDCNLVQLRHTVSPAVLYRNYWYRSGINEAMRTELTDIVHAGIKMVGGLEEEDVVLDVGANDGYLLSRYKRGRRIAFEPAANLQESLKSHADQIYPHFFPSLASMEITDRSVKILTSIAMFYDLESPKLFVKEVDRVLAEKGVWIVQMQDLRNMVRATAFDNIVHEHLCYYSFQTFRQLLQETDADLEIVRVDNREINGGSLRFYLRRRLRYGLDKLVDAIRLEEVGIDHDALQRFAWRVGQYKDQLLGTLQHYTDEGHLIDLYAASTKSSTLLQYCGINTDLIRQAAERSPEKWGKVTSGTRIPVVSEETWRTRPAPITLIGAWQFKDQFLVREADYLQKGGMFLAPLPVVEIICAQSS